MRLPRPPRPVLSRRCSPAAAPPPPWRRSGRSAPPLHHSGSGSPGPSAKTFKLETSREAAREPYDPAPPPEVRGHSRDLGSEPPLGRARSAPGTPRPNPRPQRLPSLWDLGSSASSFEALVPAHCDTDPHPRIEGQEGTFPGLGFSGCPAARSEGWVRVRTAPPTDCRERPVWRVRSYSLFSEPHTTTWLCS